MSLEDRRKPPKSDKAQYLERLTEREKLDFLIDEAKDVEELWRAHRIELQRRRSQLPP